METGRSGVPRDYRLRNVVEMLYKPEQIYCELTCACCLCNVVKNTIEKAAMTKAKQIERLITVRTSTGIINFHGRIC